MSDKTDATASTTTANRRKRTKEPSERPRASSPPWVKDGIDYGPAMLALDQLAAWAFDLAAADVADSPADARRVRSARRAVSAALAGKRIGRGPTDDLIFTAELLVRIFDADLALGVSDAVEILDGLGLPTEPAAALPSRKRPRPSGARRPVVAPPSGSQHDRNLVHLIASLALLSPIEVATVERAIEHIGAAEHDAIVSAVCERAPADAAAWLRAHVVALAPTPITAACRHRAVRVVPRPRCTACPAAAGLPPRAA